MTALLSMLAAKAAPYIIGGGAIIAAFVAAYVKGRSAGRRTAETAQKAKEADSYAKHLQDIADAAGARPSGSVSDDPYNRDNR